MTSVVYVYFQNVTKEIYIKGKIVIKKQGEVVNGLFYMFIDLFAFHCPVYF